MRVVSRLQWAVIAFVTCPTWAAAQISGTGTGANTAVAESQFSAVPISAPVMDATPPGGTAATGTATPAPNLEAEPIPAPVTPPDPRAAEGPTTSAATAGIHAHTAREDLTTRQLADRASGNHSGLGTDGALMIVGGAGFIAGLIIGGGAGTAIAIAGAVIALYGLFLYLR